MNQEIKEIPLKDLFLWGENPRDPIGSQTNQEIADRAISRDGRKRWSLNALQRSMEQQAGKILHKNELPTVCYHDEKAVVYDGNRRVLIGMIIHDYVTIDTEQFKPPKGFIFPENIDCNVCDKKTAVNIVDRMHASDGSWGPLERDEFKYKYMKKDKTPFLIIEKSTNIISKHPHLNQGFVQNEVFTVTNLESMGFHIKNGKLYSKYDDAKDADKVLLAVSEIILNEKITTRVNRGKIIELLKDIPEIKKIISKCKKINDTPHSSKNIPKQSKRTTKNKAILFGEKLQLKEGPINNLYLDLSDLYNYFEKTSTEYTNTIVFIRMGLRLLFETSFKKDLGISWKKKVKKYFLEAKENLSEDNQATLFTQAVTPKKFINLLNIGAHNYSTASNKEQTYALSLILGQMLKKHYGKPSQ